MCARYYYWTTRDFGTINKPLQTRVFPINISHTFHHVTSTYFTHISSFHHVTVTWRVISVMWLHTWHTCSPYIFTHVHPTLDTHVHPTYTHVHPTYKCDVTTYLTHMSSCHMPRHKWHVRWHVCNMMNCVWNTSHTMTCDMTKCVWNM